MTKADFYDWKRHPVTQQVFSQIQERIEYIKDQLVMQQGYSDEKLLAERAGMAQAFQFLLNIEYEEETHGS